MQNVAIQSDVGKAPQFPTLEGRTKGDRVVSVSSSLPWVTLLSGVDPIQRFGAKICGHRAGERAGADI